MSNSLTGIAHVVLNILVSKVRQVNPEPKYYREGLIKSGCDE